MATINFQQTDTAHDCAKTAPSDTASPSCTATSITPAPKIAVAGGTAGSVEITKSISGSSSFERAQFVNCDVDAGASWDAGTWTLRMDVTTSNMNLTLVGCRICRYSSGSGCAAQEELGFDNALSVPLDTTGVKSWTISGAAGTPSAGDIVSITNYIQNGSMNAASFGWTPSQLIDSPFNDAPPTPGDPLPMVIYSGIIPFR